MRWSRQILFGDVDAMFASAAVVKDPSLAGKPVAVGGPPPRGIIAAALAQPEIGPRPLPQHEGEVFRRERGPRRDLGLQPGSFGRRQCQRGATRCCASR